MWIFSKLFSWASEKSFADEGWYSITQFFWGWNSSIYKRYSQSELLNLYKGWIYAWSDAIGDGMAMLDWNLYKTEEKIDVLNHEYINFIDSQMMKATAVFLKTLWEVYFYKMRAWNKIIWLKMLKPWNVVESTWSFWDVVWYKYFDGAWFYDFSKDDLIIFKSFSPMFTQSGMSPLKAAASQMAMDLASIEYNRLFFENGWKPGTVLKSPVKIDPEVRDKYLRKWKENFVGLQNSNKVAFLDQWIDIQDMSATQKDMELTNQRTFTRDEILMMFRVWTPILGKSDWVGFADKRVPWYYLTQFVLRPLGELIKEELNKQLFNWIWHFSFNYPEDKDDILKEYQANTISLNEYRVLTGKKALKDWDILWDWTPIAYEETKKKEVSSSIEAIISKSLESHYQAKEFWTEEYNQKMWEQKISRTDKYEEELAKLQKRIWKFQEEEIIANLWSEKSIKKIEKEWDVFDSKKSKILYISLFTKFFKDMMSKEWSVSIQEISAEMFSIAKLNKWIWENIERMSDDIDKTTRVEILDIVKQWNRDKVWVAQIAASVRSKFSEYTRKSWRIEKIVRTEITRASNKSQEEAYVQSGVVAQKEWYTAIDERRCQYCADLHGKKIKLWEDFLKLGTTHLWQKIDYETISFPPRHVNCRCTERPIISRRRGLEVQEYMKTKWVSFNTNTTQDEWE